MKIVTFSQQLFKNFAPDLLESGGSKTDVEMKKCSSKINQMGIVGE